MSPKRSTNPVVVARCRRRASAITASVATGPPANTSAGGDTTLAPFGEHVVDRRLARAVEHEAEPAVVAVLEDEHDGPVEVRVDEGRCRDEQSSAERFLLGHERDIGTATWVRLVSGGRSIFGDERFVRSARGVARRGRTGERPHRSRRHRRERRRLDRPVPRRTDAVVRPGTVDEVAAVLALCNAARGRRRPAGREHRSRRRFGAPARRARARSPAPRLDRRGRRARTGQVTAAAGVTLARLQQQARRRGLAVRRRSRARARSRPSAGRSRPTPAACTCCATGRRAASSSASRRCWPTAA